MEHLNENENEKEKTGTSSNCNNNESEESNRPACAACRHQRKKCKKDCIFFSHFPADKQEEFKSVHQIFGISNLTKMLKDVDLENRSHVVKSAIWEATTWTDKNLRQHGPLGLYNELEQKLKQTNESLKETSDELEKLKSQSLASSSAPTSANSFSISNREEYYHSHPVALSTPLAPTISSQLEHNTNTVGPINSHPRYNIIQNNNVVADSNSPPMFRTANTIVTPEQIPLRTVSLPTPIQQAIISIPSSQLDYNTNMIVPLNSRSSNRYHPYNQQPQQFIDHGRHNYFGVSNQYQHQRRNYPERVFCQQVHTVQNNSFTAEQHNEVKTEKGTKDSNGG